MNAGILDRPDDEPSKREEEAIDRMNRAQRRAADQLAKALAKIDWSLTNSAARSRRLKVIASMANIPQQHDRAMDALRSLSIERMVQDRLLNARLVLKPCDPPVVVNWEAPRA